MAECRRCGAGNLSYREDAHGKPYLYDVYRELPHKCNGMKHESDYIMCFTHQIALRNGKCPKDSKHSKCTIFVQRSKYLQLKNKISSLNDHKHDWYSNSSNEIRFMHCHKTTTECFVFGVTKQGLPMFEIDSLHSPLDKFLTIPDILNNSKL